MKIFTQNRLFIDYSFEVIYSLADIQRLNLLIYYFLEGKKGEKVSSLQEKLFIQISGKYFRCWERQIRV